MSVNKILALIGAILASLIGGILGLVGLIGGIGAIAAGTDVSQYAPVLGVLMILFGLIALGMVAVNWVAFVHLDKPNDRPWKVYFLVAGILTVLSIYGIIPGVLFILTFALNVNKTKPETANAQTVWENNTFAEANVSPEVSTVGLSESKVASELVSSETSPISNSAFAWTEAISESEQGE